MSDNETKVDADYFHGGNRCSKTTTAMEELKLFCNPDNETTLVEVTKDDLKPGIKFNRDGDTYEVTNCNGDILTYIDSNAAYYVASASSLLKELNSIDIMTYITFSAMEQLELYGDDYADVDGYDEFNLLDPACASSASTPFEYSFEVSFDHYLDDITPGPKSVVKNFETNPPVSPKPLTNDNRTTCYHCQAPTKEVAGFLYNSTYNICTKCDK